MVPVRGRVGLLAVFAAGRLLGLASKPAKK
jgi:hypothetical protein